MVKKKETRQEDDPVRQKQLVQVISQKDALQVQGRKQQKSKRFGCSQSQVFFNVGS
jgi:hypothetical protein